MIVVFWFVGLFVVIVEFCYLSVWWYWVECYGCNWVDGGWNVWICGCCVVLGVLEVIWWLVESRMLNFVGWCWCVGSGWCWVFFFVDWWLIFLLVFWVGFVMWWRVKGECEVDYFVYCGFVVFGELLDCSFVVDWNSWLVLLCLIWYWFVVYVVRFVCRCSVFWERCYWFVWKVRLLGLVVGWSLWLGEVGSSVFCRIWWCLLVSFGW